MIFIITLGILAYVEANITNFDDSEDCKNVVDVNGQLHDKIIIDHNFDRPYQLSIDRESELLFFSFSIGNETQDNFKSGVIDLKDDTLSIIPNINNGFASAIDNGTIYLGGSDGLYTYDKETKSANCTYDTQENIWSIFPSDGLYIISYPKMILHTLRNDEYKIAEDFEEEKIMQFAVDETGNKYFYNDTALYLVTPDNTINEAIMLTDEIVIRGISLNKMGEAYFSGEGGIYKVVDKVLKNIMIEYDVFGHAFDNDDNIIYATTKNLVKLKPSYKNCKVIKEKSNL